MIETAGARVIVECNGNPATWDLTAEDQSVLRHHLNQVWHGAITPADAIVLGRTLGLAFTASPGATAEQAVELRSSQPWLLTDIPWEFAQFSGNDGGEPRCLGDRTLLRVQKIDVSQQLAARPTVLVAVAHITGQLKVPIFPAQYVPTLGNVLRTAPPFQVVCELGADVLQAIYAEHLFAAARNYDPDVVVLVAHGKANPPTVYFEDDQTSQVGAPPKGVTVADLAQKLGRPRLCDPAVLRRNAHDRRPVRRLVADPLRCTGSHHDAGRDPQNLAAAFVKRALITLHRRGGLGEAVLAGRAAIGASPHSLTPVGFSALGVRTSADRWEAARKGYDAALAALLPSPIQALPRTSLDKLIERSLETPGCRVCDRAIRPDRAIGGGCLRLIF